MDSLFDPSSWWGEKGQGSGRLASKLDTPQAQVSLKPTGSSPVLINTIISDKDWNICLRHRLALKLALLKFKYAKQARIITQTVRWVERD